MCKHAPLSSQPVRQRQTVTPPNLTHFITWLNSLDFWVQREVGSHGDSAFGQFTHRISLNEYLWKLFRIRTWQDSHLLRYQIFVENAFCAAASSLLGRISVLSPGSSARAVPPCVRHASQCGGAIKEAALWTAEAREREKKKRHTEWKFDARLRNPDAELTVESEPPTDSCGHHSISHVAALPHLSKPLSFCPLGKYHMVHSSQPNTQAQQDKNYNPH